VALITAQELIEEVYRRMAQDSDVADSATAASDDNPNYPRAVVLAYLNDAEANFRMRLSEHTSLWRGYATLDITTGVILLPDDCLGDVQLTVWRNGAPEFTIQRVEESWLDERRPGWRNETADVPTQFIVKQTEESSGGMTPVITQRLGVYLVPQPSADITDGIRGPYTVKPTEMSANTDACTSLLAFPPIQRTVLPLDVLGNMISYGSTEAADQRADSYKARYEREMGVARRICAGLAKRTHASFRGGMRV
jgi:hypothetical protein